MPLSIQELLDRSRKELLDLSTRNRLLSIPVNSKSARIIQVYDELSAEVFRMLVNEKKALSFLPGKQTKQPESTDTQLFDSKRSAYPAGRTRGIRYWHSQTSSGSPTPDGVVSGRTSTSTSRSLYQRSDNDRRAGRQRLIPRFWTS